MVLFHSVLNGCILALLLLFALQYQVVRNSEVADARYTLAYYLFSSGDRNLAFLHRRIETIDEFVSILERTVRSYYTVPTRSRGLFMHYTDFNATLSRERDGIAAPELFLRYHEGYSGSPAYARVLDRHYGLTLDNPVGPFANASALLHNWVETCDPAVDVVAGGTFIPCRVSAIGDLLDRVVQLRLSFSFFSRGRRSSASSGMANLPSTWDVVVDYGFEGHKAVMTMATSLFSVSQRERERGPLLVCWMVCCIALVDLYWRLRTAVKAGAASTSKHASSAEASPLTPQRSAADRARRKASEVKEEGWRWLGYLSNAVVLAFAATALIAQHRRKTGDTLEEAVTLLLAFAILLSSFRVVVLLKLFPAWYVLIDGLATALAQLSVLAVGVVPVLVGFAVCGTAVFGGFSNSTYFQSIPAAIVTMLCSMFGDNLFDTFLRMDQSPHVLQIFFARLFFVTFMALFVCNILNIAHSIIQDSYSQALKSYGNLVAAREAANMAGATVASVPQPPVVAAGAAAEGTDSVECRRNDEATPCVCGATAVERSASTSASSDDSSRCSLCGRSRARQRRHGPALKRGKLDASEVERMVRRLNELPRPSL